MAYDPERQRQYKLKYNRTEHGKADNARRCKAQRDSGYKWEPSEEAKAKRQAYLASDEAKALARARRAKYDAKPEVKLLKMMRHRLRMFFKGQRTVSAVRDLGCTAEEFRAYLQTHPRWNPEVMTLENHGTAWHIDHVKALGLFTDLSDPDQARQATHYTNLQPLTTADHTVKTIEDNRQIRAMKKERLAHV